MSKFSLRDEASILEAIPAILGFTPTNSIVLVLLERTGQGGDVKNLLRFDIDREAASKLTTVTAPAFIGASAAILIAVHDQPFHSIALEVLETVAASLASIKLGNDTEITVPVLMRLTTTDLNEAGNWTNIDTGEQGTRASYRDGILSAETIFLGRSIAADRDAITAEFTTAIVNPTPVTGQDPAEFLVETFETIAAIITGSAHPAAHPELATHAGIAITHNVHVRDALLALCVDHAQQAAALWTRLANQLTGEARIHALAIAATLYYASDDGVRTGIALDVAREEALASGITYPTLAQLIDNILAVGVPPARVRNMLETLTVRLTDD